MSHVGLVGFKPVLAACRSYRREAYLTVHGPAHVPESYPVQHAASATVRDRVRVMDSVSGVGGDPEGCVSRVVE